MSKRLIIVLKSKVAYIHKEFKCSLNSADVCYQKLERFHRGMSHAIPSTLPDYTE
jgi:hypothetical protein